MAQRSSGYARQTNDLYQTPKWVTDIILDYAKDRLEDVPIIWEPACGEGKMVRALEDFYKHTPKIIHGSDLEMNFLEVSETAWQCPCIITNPPYKHAQKFVEKALRLTQDQQGYVAMLLDSSFDNGKTRGHLFKNHPAFRAKIIITERIVWFPAPEGEKQKSPSSNHAWFVWDWKFDSYTPDIIYWYKKGLHANS